MLYFYVHLDMDHLTQECHFNDEEIPENVSFVLTTEKKRYFSRFPYEF